MKKLGLILFALLFSLVAISGNGDKRHKNSRTHSFQGKILDESSAEALTGATVRIVELNKTVYADWNGGFDFQDIPSGSYTIEISFVSYPTKTLEGFRIDRDLKDNFLL